MITFVFTTKPGNLLSWCIRTVSGRKFSHVSVIAHSNEIDRDVLFQATLPNTTIQSPEIFFAIETVVEKITFPITDLENKTTLQFMVDNSGKGYATTKLFGILWKRLVKRLGRDIKNPADDQDKTEECAESSALILRDCLGLKTTEDLESVDPGWVYDQVQAMAKTRNA